MSDITKNLITKKPRNCKLEEKCYINENTHLATEKKFVLHHSWKLINGGVLMSSGGSGKNQKIYKHIPPFIGHLRVFVSLALL